MSGLNVLIYYPGRLNEYVQLLSEHSDRLNLLPCDTDDDIDRHIAKADILFVSTRFPTNYIERAEKLKWIQVMGAGVEKFTKEIVLPEGVILSRVNTYFGYKIAEYVFAYLLAICQRVQTVEENKKKKLWRQLDLEWLQGQHMGIVGTGAIGSEMAKKAISFGMTVSGCDLSTGERPFFDSMYPIDELSDFIAKMKYVVICLPLTRETEGLFGIEEFKRMRMDAYIINTARGAIIRERDLVKALKEGMIRGAILDVFEQEPLPHDSPLWEMGNVIITPHHAGPSIPREIVEFFLGNLDRYNRGEKLEGLVDLKRGF
jgi:phosphoglycerate dehydrogenase-like enzyme